MKSHLRPRTLAVIALACGLAASLLERRIQRYTDLLYGVAALAYHDPTLSRAEYARYVSALELAAPALVALLVTDIAFGLVSRVMPQLNIFAVGFPMKIGVAMLVVAASLPFLGGFLSNQVAAAVSSALQAV